MDEKERGDYESRSHSLRLELKAWESSWARSHDNKKPTRDDIKQNPEIAQKYKSYNKLRDILSGKTPRPPGGPASPLKRKPDGPPAPAPASRTPSKRPRPAETPVKRRGATTSHDADPAASPGGGGELPATPALSRRLFGTPAAPTSIGPTPQRDGRVLGLFDLLGDETPSRPRPPAPEAAPAAATMTTTMTPPRRRAPPPAPAPPGSASSSGTQFATPEFLKRGAAPPADGSGFLSSPRPLRLPRKPLVRGLSSVVASLRKMEEEELDGDLEVLRELEMELGMGTEAGPAGRRSSPGGMRVAGAGAGAGAGARHDLGGGGGGGGGGPGDAAGRAPVEVGDSQARPALLGGFDDEALYDSPVDEELDRDGRPLRVFKKKGQKRTTRLVKMRPTRSRRPTSTAEAEDGEAGETIPETQTGSAVAPESGGGLLGAASGSEFDGSEPERSDADADRKKAKGKMAEGKAEGGEGGVVKRAVRKVKATAHANFKRLKLRNSGAKGGPGYNSRFRRRR